MKKIYSKITPSKLLHIIHFFNDIDELKTSDKLARTNVVPDEHFLQLAALKLDRGKTFKAHKHIYKESPESCIAQESWVVLKGRVKAYLYDIDDSLIDEFILNEGDCSLTLEGGHNYESLTDGSIVYEYKTGPYQGIELDKVFL